MGDSVRSTHPITVDMLFSMFKRFKWSPPLHVCMHAAFLVAFFSFLRISNLLPYSLADLHSLQSERAYFLTRNDVRFTSSCAILPVYRTKTMQFSQRVLREIPLPFIPNSILCPVSAGFVKIFSCCAGSCEFAFICHPSTWYF